MGKWLILSSYSVLTNKGVSIVGVKGTFTLKLMRKSSKCTLIAFKIELARSRHH